MTQKQEGREWINVIDAIKKGDDAARIEGAYLIKGFRSGPKLFARKSGDRYYTELVNVITKLSDKRCEFCGGFLPAYLTATYCHDVSGFSFLLPNSQESCWGVLHSRLRTHQHGWTSEDFQARYPDVRDQLCAVFTWFQSVFGENDIFAKALREQILSTMILIPFSWLEIQKELQRVVDPIKRPAYPSRNTTKRFSPEVWTSAFNTIQIFFDVYALWRISQLTHVHWVSYNAFLAAVTYYNAEAYAEFSRIAEAQAQEDEQPPEVDPEELRGIALVKEEGT